MFNGNYKKIDTILPQVRKYPFMEGITKREVSHNLVSLLQLVGATVPLIRTYANIEIVAHKGVLPKDIMFIHGANNKGNSCDNQGVVMQYASDIYNSALHSTEAKAVACGTSTTGTVLPAEVATGDTKTVGEVGQIIANIVNVDDPDVVTYENSYNINGMSIDCSFPAGWVEIAYDRIQTDDEGYPMIPDNASFSEALRYFVIKQHAEPAYYRGDVAQHVWNDINTNYDWYVGQAGSGLTMLTADQMQSMANGLMRILPVDNPPSDGYKQANKLRH